MIEEGGRRRRSVKEGVGRGGESTERGRIVEEGAGRGLGGEELGKWGKGRRGERRKEQYVW